MNGIIRSFVAFFFIIAGLLFVVSCNSEKADNLDDLKINISGPIRNDTIITEDEFEEIEQRFSILIENTRKDSIFFVKTIQSNTEIAPYAIEHIKVLGDSLVRRQGIADLWNDEYLKIEPASSIERYFNAYFFADFDTLHFFFKYKTGEKFADKSLQVSYTIKNGKLSKKIGTKYFD